MSEKLISAVDTAGPAGSDVAVIGSDATGDTGTGDTGTGSDVAEEEKIKKNEAIAAAPSTGSGAAAPSTTGSGAAAPSTTGSDVAVIGSGATGDTSPAGSDVAATSAAASTTASGAASAAAPPKPARNVNIVKYAIIEIKDETISVTNDATGLNTEKTPRQCLTEGANCKFALQISKIDCTTLNGICIEFEKSNYLLDLDIIVPKETDFSGKLIDEAFLVPAATTDTSSTSASTGTSASASTSPGASTGASSDAPSTASAAATSGAYTPDNVKQFLSIESNKNNFNNYLNLDSSTDKKFGENINYLKIAKSVVTNSIEIDTRDKCENLISEAAAYALNILDKYTSDIADNDTQYSEILTAFEILNAVDPLNENNNAEDKKEKINVLNGGIKDKINTKNIITDVNTISIDSKGPAYESIPKLTGYTPVIVDQGGSGNCFYYSVWGGLIELGDEKYKKIIEDLTNFAKTLKSDSDVDFTDTFANKETFNINIRKLLALCFLAETNNTIYTSYNNMWNTGQNGVNTLLEAIKDLAYGLRTLIQSKCKEYQENSGTKFFTPEEFKNILANNVIVNGVFATQIEVDMIKKVFSNCNVILDVYSPAASIDYLKDKLPTVFNDFSYIYVRHTGGEHYQQIQTTTNETKDCTFTRENSNGESPFWKYNSVSTGGSRKNRQQKSKKTKRNYYTYKK
jgi:hypothetical protein